MEGAADLVSQRGVVLEPRCTVLVKGRDGSTVEASMMRRKNLRTSTAATLAALLILHLRWRRKLVRAQEQSRKEIRDLKDEHRREALQIQTQQEAVFNSMVEGLLLLDQSGRIRLANDAFAALFGVVADVRGKTIMEALRLHELAELSDFLGTEQQVSGFELKLTGPPERWLQVNGAAIFSGAGERHGTILVFHELTRLKQLESARKEFVATKPRQCHFKSNFTRRPGHKIRVNAIHGRLIERRQSLVEPPWNCVAT